MRGWHGTMKRVSAEQVISVTLAHSLHLHDVYSRTRFLKKNLKKTPASNVELKVFSVGLFRDCHPFMGIHIEEHFLSSLSLYGDEGHAPQGKVILSLSLC